MVGLGKMGGNMRTRLQRAGIEVTGYDRDPSGRWPTWSPPWMLPGSSG
jgi:3-hydroxyisobutyrate dehydrogenase-like beta-hydroxyacid dehydrogenase